MVCHHNHLSHESLSSADWRGLIRVFNETWAHCEDGTRYYGQVLDVNGVERVLRRNYQALETRAETDLFNILSAQGHPEAVALAALFRKEVMNRAMLIRDLVAYEFDWGFSNLAQGKPANPPSLTSNAGHYGRALHAHIDRVATAIAPAM